MARVGVSARGEAVDFDLLEIKAQLAAAPQTIEIANRKKYIDLKESGKSIKDSVSEVYDDEDDAEEII